MMLLRLPDTELHTKLRSAASISATISARSSFLAQTTVSKPKTSTEPRGKLTLRTLAMPADTNPAGDIFGGWVMSQMDIGSGL